MHSIRFHNGNEWMAPMVRVRKTWKMFVRFVVFHHHLLHSLLSSLVIFAIDGQPVVSVSKLKFIGSNQWSQPLPPPPPHHHIVFDFYFRFEFIQEFHIFGKRAMSLSSIIIHTFDKYIFERPLRHYYHNRKCQCNRLPSKYIIIHCDRTTFASFIYKRINQWI